MANGVLRIDEDRHQVTVRGELVELTPTEWGVLTTLARTPGRVYSRYELINSVRGYEFEGYERTIDSHVKNLRRKIEQRPAETDARGDGARRRVSAWCPGRWLNLATVVRCAARLVLAFVAVAVAAVAALAVVIVLTTRSETGRLSASDRARNRQARPHACSRTRIAARVRGLTPI